MGDGVVRSILGRGASTAPAEIDSDDAPTAMMTTPAGNTSATNNVHHAQASRKRKGHPRRDRGNVGPARTSGETHGPRAPEGPPGLLAGARGPAVGDEDRASPPWPPPEDDEYTSTNVVKTEITLSTSPVVPRNSTGGNRRRSKRARRAVVDDVVVLEASDEGIQPALDRVTGKRKGASVAIKSERQGERA
eukprot:g12151.t1